MTVIITLLFYTFIDGENEVQIPYMICLATIPEPENGRARIKFSQIHYATIFGNSVQFCRLETCYTNVMITKELIRHFEKKNVLLICPSGYALPTILGLTLTGRIFTSSTTANLTTQYPC